MRKKILWITETAVLLALLVTAQALTKGFGQIVTGSFVNAILAVAVLVGGMSCGITVALISPIFAFLLNIAPRFIVIIPIMAGNACFVTLLRMICGKQKTPLWKQSLGLTTAATAKFVLMYLLVVHVICGVASNAFLNKTLGNIVLLTTGMLTGLPTQFDLDQLFAALIGGGVALCIAPILRKALHK